MLLSDYLKNGVTLQGVAGVAAINSNDLLLLNAQGNLYPVAVADMAATANAGAALVPSTLLQTSAGLNATVHREVFVSPIDGGIYAAYPHMASNCGMTLVKYTPAGVLVRSVIVVSATSSQLNNPIITQLSNGNILVVAGILGTPSSVYYAVYDQNLNQVVAPVSYATATTLGVDAIALVGGGFAIAYPAATGVCLAIFTNAGGVVYAGTAITGSPTAGVSVRMLQLSNGNLAFAINSSVANKALGHAISTLAGATVLAYTALGNATSAGSVYPTIAQMNGFYAVAVGDGTNNVCYVLNNGGAVQGAPYSVANTNTASIFLFSDGIGFWLVYASSTAANAIVYVPTAGAGYVVNLTGINCFTAFLDRGLIVITGTAGTAYTFKLSAGATGVVSRLADVTFTGNFGQQTIVPGGDFTLACFSWPGNIYLAVYKYMSAVVVGVSQMTVPANSAGTIVPYSMGPGGYPCNPVNGTVGKGFDHSAAVINGNKGAILGSAVSLKGI